MRTRVYIDGYNLYYSCLKHSGCKWLDINSLANMRLPKNQIEKVRYFTARVSARPHDPTQPQRQETYFRALATCPEVEIHFGHFLTHEVGMPDAKAWKEQNQFKPVRVIKTEEKGSDVNLASHLLMDAFDDQYDAAVVISNDSDLAEPIRLVRERFNKPVGLLLHKSVRISGKLKPLASFVRTFNDAAIAKAQFPNTLVDKNGTFSKPSTW